MWDGCMGRKRRRKVGEGNEWCCCFLLESNHVSTHEVLTFPSFGAWALDGHLQPLSLGHVRVQIKLTLSLISVVFESAAFVNEWR